MAGTDTVVKIADDYWEWRMNEFPEEATGAGDHRFADRLTDLSRKAAIQRGAAAGGFLKRIDAIGHFDGEDTITADVLRFELEEIIEGQQLHLDELWVDHLDGPQSSFRRLVGNHPRRNARDIETLLARYRAYPRLLQQYCTNLRVGIVNKRTAPRVIVERVIKQLHELLATDPAKSAFVTAANDVPSLPRAEHERLRASLSDATRDQLYPAFRTLLDFFEREYLPHARPEIGLWAVANGQQIYALTIRQRTTTRLTPAELHEMGKRELAHIAADMQRVAEPLKVASEPRIIEQSLTHAAEAPLTDPAQILAEYRRTVDRFRSRLPEQFGSLPSADLRIEAMPEFMQRHAPGAYYEFPSEDDHRPGTFHVNLSQPQPRYKIEALAAHEAMPGHHLQVSVAHSQHQLPKIRRTAEVTAFVEGWGLYSERLVDEMGLYTDERSRFGMLAGQSWRAARLVVDTGIHAMKWTREQAIDFMMAHSTLPRPEIEAEVDRYIVWPAQGMSYMVGELEIMAARSEAERTMGSKFSRRAFHDRLLASGAVPLYTMRSMMSAWAKEHAAR